MSSSVPGSARLVLASDVRHLNEPQAVFSAMLTGWQRQLRSRSLSNQTVDGRISLIRRFNEFAGSYPWAWTPGDMEDFTLSLMSGPKKAAPSTIRGYHLMIRMFCDYLLDGRYGWVEECQKRFDQFPSQVCHDYNTVAHMTDYEGHPARRPFTYDEIQHLFDFLDTRVERIKVSGRKGAWAALRDAQIVKTIYAYGLRRREACMLDIADLRPNPQMPQWGTYGAVHVRYGKAVRGGVPRRRTVLTVPEFDWVVAGLTQWVEQARPLVLGTDTDGRLELWPTERRGRIDPRTLDLRFAWVRKEAGLPEELTLHCLRHSYVTHLIEFGYPERFVTEQVGHSYASTTAIYTSVSNDFKAKTLQAALGRVYGNEEGYQ